MVLFCAIYIAFLSGGTLMGWAHQAAKSPEQQHLEELIDCNDPYAMDYSIKIWGQPKVFAIAENGQQYALI